MIRWLKDNPWGWPMTILGGLLIIVIVGVALSLTFAGCAAGPRGPATPAQNDSVTDLTERHITLSDGRFITCVTLGDYDYTNEVSYSGLSCDWEGAVYANE